LLIFILTLCHITGTCMRLHNELSTMALSYVFLMEWHSHNYKSLVL